ncbi:MAG: ABC transporter ATP-binding protein [Conexivisphaerales archaeon]
MSDTYIRTDKLKKYFPASNYGLLERLTKHKPLYVHAVDGVDIKIDRGKTVGLVGESGSGKTTLGRMLTTLESPTSGKIFFDGEDMQANIGTVRKKVQIVFQNPFESLDPRMSLYEILEEPLLRNRLSKEEKLRVIKEALEAVGMDYSSYYYRKAKDLSGGQRQRVAVARAVISNPEFIVLDEPTSALDASIQSQVLNLLLHLKREHKYTYLLITHNIAVANYVSDFIYIMYAGKIVEGGNTETIMKFPKHPYTQLLLKSAPSFNSKNVEPMQGETPSLINVPSGCRFHPRCPYAFNKCKVEEPQLVEIEFDHWVSCFLY